jgi:secretion/DNA translocation related CpaE-like protein
VTAVRHPLLVTSDPAVRDDVLRLAAAAGVDVDTAAEPAAVRLRWHAAPLVLLGGDALSTHASLDLPTRRGVTVICRGSPPPALWPRAVECGAERVISLPDGEAALVDLLADAVERCGEPARVVAVIGGRGGAGASLLAAGLAVTAARRGRHTLLVDADPSGGGLDLVLGAESTPGLRWADLAATSGRVSAVALRRALPVAHGAALLSFDRNCPRELPADALRSVLTAGQRAGGLVVVDLPRQATPSTAAALRLADLALLVVTPELRAVAAAARLAESVREWADNLQVLVRRTSVGDLPPGEIARTLRLPLAGQFRSEPGLAGTVERGIPPAGRDRGPLAAVCRQILHALDTAARGEAA